MTGLFEFHLLYYHFKWEIGKNVLLIMHCDIGVSDRDYIVAKKPISIIVAVHIAISQYRRPSGKASGNEGEVGEGRETISYLTFDTGC